MTGTGSNGRILFVVSRRGDKAAGEGILRGESFHYSRLTLLVRSIGVRRTPRFRAKQEATIKTFKERARFGSGFIKASGGSTGRGGAVQYLCLTLFVFSV